MIIRLPADVLTCIIKHVHDEGSSQFMLPLLTVSKSLNMLAYPFLVRSLNFTNDAQLSRAATAIEYHDFNGKPLGSCIRFITVKMQAGANGYALQSPQSLSSTANLCLVRILLRATCLQLLSIKNIFDPAALAVPSLHSFSSILQLELDIGVSTDSHETLISITEYINRFDHLKKLNIRSWSHWPNIRTPAIKLPHLTYLSWDSFAPDFGSNTAFLARCQFNNLETLDISQRMIPQIQTDGMADLRIFLSHLTHLKTVTMMVEDYSAIFPHLPASVTKLDFTSVPFNEDVAILIPHTVQELSICASCTGIGDEWKALEVLENINTGIRVIHIDFWSWNTDPHPFKWVNGLAAAPHAGQDDGDPALSELAIFTTRMLGHATKLSQKGIKLVDTTGRAASVQLS